ncbi:MAGUK p55 subfamily member 7 isoform X1 [Homo sapiens]|uniref:MAGUK p55 subfamily member 7 isoform X1 n=3 Tax=Homo sapiens TaxID=9606 RepID=UPI0007DC68C1|nr:MAGUK p55 subfamily member 7 isoform X1 [Homo sapiens]|eukprot:XP_016871230.1 MAGUK p55 subfamily member 7 isoform X1 [Homo sapiens]
MHRLFANTGLFYIRGLRISRFWYRETFRPHIQRNDCITSLYRIVPKTNLEQVHSNVPFIFVLLGIAVLAVAELNSWLKRLTKYTDLGRQRGCRLLNWNSLWLSEGRVSGERWADLFLHLASCQLCQRDLGVTLIHEKLHYYEKQSPVPILHGAAALADDLAEELQNKPLNSEIRELLKLLSKPNVKALLSVHDTVAQKNYDPVLPPMPEDIDDEEDSVKIIRLVKNREPLGATIKKDEQTGAIIVARIMRGGAADRSGLIHVGDELREVNGIPVEDKRPEEIIQILAQSQGAITFKIIPGSKEETPSKEGKMFIKALFDYNPNEDKAIPCKEAGLSFKKGDILQIMSQDDATWWQAKHEADANPRAGLIPSKHFQERRLALRRPEILVQPLKVSNRKSSGFRKSFRLSRKDKKTNKSMYECKKSDQYDTADVPTYEEVTPYRRQTNEKYRLVVLVGPVGVGLNELKRKLLISDTQHYGVTVPHTTRARRSQESDGVEYIFISKHLFETDVQNNKFIEYGEYKNNYYGTSIDSVRSVLAKNKVCLLDVQPHTVKHLRTLEFKPYVIFIKPPSIERLRETRKNAKIISSRDDQGAAKPFTEEDFQEMIKSAQIMESQYGHLFDKIIINDDLTVAFNELKTTFDKLETETHWVPVSWLHS